MREPKYVALQSTTLRAAEKRKLEMIAAGASLRDVLDQLCGVLDVQVAPSVTTILLMDADGKCLRSRFKDPATFS